MRILLCAANFCDDPYPVYPLGMSVVASALAGAGHEVRQFDAYLYGREHYGVRLREVLTEFRPALTGVSIRNLDHIDSRVVDDGLLAESFGVIRELQRGSSAPLFLGGPGFSLYPEEILTLTGAQYGIAGEGEDAVIRLAAAIEAGDAPAPGVLRGKCAVQRRALYDPEIAGFYHEETHLLPLQTKRGCLFRCGYCTYPALEGKTLRGRDLDEVIDDIEMLHAHYPDAMLYFVDAVFNDPERRFEALLRRMRERKLDVPWTGFITPKGVREGDLEFLCENGMIAADLGLDAASDATLAGLDKGFTFEVARRCCRRLLELGVGVTNSVMFGGPGESYETIREGIANLRSLEGAYSAVFSGIRLLRGAPLLETARREGKVPPEWNGVGSLYYFAPGLDPERVNDMLTEAFGDDPYCIYPPGSRNRDLRTLHRFGYAKLHKLQLSGRRR